MSTEMERCENCGLQIGRLERANLYNERIVCGACFARLQPASASPNRAWPTPLNWTIIISACIVAVGLVTGSLVLVFTRAAPATSPEAVGKALPKLPLPQPPIVSPVKPPIESPAPPSLILSDDMGLGLGVPTGLVVTSHESSPIRIDRVVFNGECDAVLATFHGWNVSAQQLPLKLTIGESQEFMWHNPNGVKEAYQKEIVFVDIYTDRGQFRYTH